MVVVGEHQVARWGLRGDFAEVDSVREVGTAASRGGFSSSQVVGLGEAARGIERGARRVPVARVLGHALAAVGGQVEVAPVDAQVVAALGEDGLFARTDAKERQAIELKAGSGGGLFGGVDDQVGRGVEVDFNLVILAIGGARRSIPDT